MFPGSDQAAQTFTSASLKTIQTHDRDDDITLNRVQLNAWWHFQNIYIQFILFWFFFKNIWMQHGRFEKRGNFPIQFYLREKILSDFWMWMYAWKAQDSPALIGKTLKCQILSLKYQN